MASKQTSGAAARRYANALVETAEESKNLDAILKDLNDLEAMLAGSQDLQRAMTSPLLDRDAQQNAMAADSPWSRPVIRPGGCWSWRARGRCL